MRPGDAIKSQDDSWGNERRPHFARCIPFSITPVVPGLEIPRVVEQIDSLLGKRVKGAAPQAALPFGKERCDEESFWCYRRRITCG